MTNRSVSPIDDLQTQYDLLRQEFDYEKEQFREQTERAGIYRRIQQGLCWYPIRTGRSYYNSLNQLVVEIFRTESPEIEHNFEYGRPVCFFQAKADNRITYLPFPAVLSSVEDDTMVVVIPSAVALLELTSPSELVAQPYFHYTTLQIMV